jgi:hypothetical protein
VSPVPRDPRGPAEGVEWHADQHDFHLPELPAPTREPAAARMLVHRLAVEPVAAENVEEVLAAAKACLLEAEQAYELAQAERAAMEDTARLVAAQRAAVADATRELAAQRAMVESATQKLAMMRAHEAALVDAAARPTPPARAARPRPKPRRPRAAVSDIPGQNLRPDPAAAQDPAGLIEALRLFRIWSGNPSYRNMAARSGQRTGVSTMWKALRAKELPARLEVIEAIVEGCGGSEEDRQRFATAWRRLTMVTGAGHVSPPGTPRLRAVPVPSPPPGAASGQPQAATAQA